MLAPYPLYFRRKNLCLLMGVEINAFYCVAPATKQSICVFDNLSVISSVLYR